jgi:signal transduction histidine kinase
MPHSTSTFLSFVNSDSGKSKNFNDLLVEFLVLGFPNDEYCVLRHIYAPDCYQALSEQEKDLRYIQILNSANNWLVSDKEEFLKLNDLLIFPLSNHENQVNLLIIFRTLPDNMMNDLSLVLKEIKEVFSFISSQIDAYSESINMRMANLVSQISHDINSLMALIPGEFTKDEALSARIKYSEILSREIMYYLREIVVEKSKVPIKDLLSGITSGIQIPKNVKLSTEFIDTVDFLTVDVDLIDRALSAIIDNAVFVTHIEGGDVWMTVSNRKNVSPFIKNDWLEIKISDTGAGIAKEFLKDVRNPFFTTWKNHGHVGLGLSIAEKIIQAHDGILQIESEPGLGTTAIIHLPMR